MTTRYQAPTVGKAFRILEHVCRADQGSTISEIARELSMGKSTVHGVTVALEETGALVRDPETKRYLPGMMLYRLGRAAHARFDLERIAHPFMVELGDRTHEAVALGVRSGDHVWVLDAVPAGRDLEITVRPGTRIPLLAGATGKVVLAAMEDHRAREAIRSSGLPAHTESSITDADEYMEVVRAVRSRGYSTDDEEYLSGVRAVAAPLNAPGRPTTVIWVVGFTSSMSLEKMGRVAEDIVRTADAISLRIEADSAGTPGEE